MKANVPGRQGHHQAQQAKQTPKIKYVINQVLPNSWLNIKCLINMSIVHCSVPGEQSQAELGSAGQQQRSGQGPSMTGGLDPEWKE